MREVQDVLTDNTTQFLWKPQAYKNIKPYNADKLLNLVSNMIMNADKVLIIYDTDVDGMLSAKILYECFKRLIPGRVTVYRQMADHHGITMAMALWIVQKNYKYVYIVDSSTNEVECLNYLATLGVQVVVLDHHESKHLPNEYISGVSIFNNKVDESNGIKIPYQHVSCGELILLYLNYIFHRFSIELPPEVWSYAVATMYSDCVNLVDGFNAMLLAHVRTSFVLPALFRGISGRGTNLITRDVLSYSINPKLNACIRLEYFDVLYTLLFEEHTKEELQELYVFINETNGTLKEFLSDMEKTLSVKVLSNVCVINMTRMSQTVYTNFKGLLANKIADQEGKLTISYYVANGMVNGSVRDPYGRDCLQIFQNYCFAEGHKPAFGFKLPEKHLIGLIDYVNDSLDEVEFVKQKPIIFSPDEYTLTLDEVKSMAVYNECAGSNFLLIRLVISPEEYKIQPTKYGYAISSVRWKIFSRIPVTYGMTVLALPVYSGNQCRLTVKFIGG